MKVLLAGDSHGDFGYIVRLAEVAKENNCDKIFILGDFGYWPHTANGRKFLEGCSKLSQQTGIRIHWIDGNHDNHPVLWSYFGEARDDAAKIGPGLYYHGRGMRWEWDGVSFMTLGGGYSIDIDYRTPWTEWWPTELITDRDVTYSIRRGKVDILLSHDCPIEVDLNIHGGHGAYKQGIKDSDMNRHLLQRVVNIKEPEVVVHGHMHIRYNDTCREGQTKVIGLGHGQGDFVRSCIILETLAGKWKFTDLIKAQMLGE